MTQRYAFWFSQPALDNRLMLCLFTVTLQLITMVGSPRIEPGYLRLQRSALSSELPSHIAAFGESGNSLSRLFIHEDGVDMAYFSCSIEACWVLFFMKVPTV